jgi:putative transposase
MVLLMTRLPEIANPTRQPYPSDLSDAEWDILKPLLPKPKGFGHPVEVDFREILNGIFYVQRTGCQWEMMPHDLPPYSTVYSYFQKWQRKGVWQQMHDQIRQQLRTQFGRDEHPLWRLPILNRSRARKKGGGLRFRRWQEG